MAKIDPPDGEGPLPLDGQRQPPQQPPQPKPNSPGKDGSSDNGHRRRSKPNAAPDGEPLPVYAALDLGTNNCRLLIAKPSRRGFVVVDSFSRIIRLGEGLSRTGALSEVAMSRTIDALRVCANKMVRMRVGRSRLVATQACRLAANGAEFLDRVQREVGLKLEILSRESEARLAVAGCGSLIDPRADYTLVFDIGGGSSELAWIDVQSALNPAAAPLAQSGPLKSASLHDWTSLPFGVVTLAEQFDVRDVSEASFEAMVASVSEQLEPFEASARMTGRLNGRQIHFLGTSGTVTTVAGLHLRLPRYDRRQVDGSWLDVADVRRVTSGLIGQTYEQRCAEPCIGRDRADLVLAGCAILEAMLRLWPTERLRVADRGLREGILSILMAEDGYPKGSRKRNKRRRARPPEAVASR